MNDQKQLLEQYLKLRLSDKAAFSIARMEKLRDGWESDNYLIGVEYGASQTRADWVWRIYSGAGSQSKASREFSSMRKLHAAGYPVPLVFVLEAENSPVDRPFIVMEYIRGETMWELIESSSVERQSQLIDQFCQLFVQLHEMDWRQFDDNLPVDDPYFFIDRWLDDARQVVHILPEFDAAPFFEWVAARRPLFACTRPSPVHQDFHPGNILIEPTGGAKVIDWTNFDVTDSRFDLAWTLMLAYAYGLDRFGTQILEAYEHHAGKPVEQIQAFEAIECARRLFDLTVSLTLGAQWMGMTDQSTQAMRAGMIAHKRVYHLFIERTGLKIQSFDNLFGN